MLTRGTQFVGTVVECYRTEDIQKSAFTALVYTTADFYTQMTYDYTENFLYVTT